MKLTHNQAVCSGCRACEMICGYAHFSVNNPRKAAVRIRNSQTHGRYEAHFCDQCGDCMEDCPIGAIYEEDGVYRIDKEQCTGCYLCVDACQRGALFVLDEEEAPLKCDLCGKCVDECTPKALLIE